MQKLDIEKMKTIIEESSPETSIYIGCDSQRHWDSKNKKMNIMFVRVVVVHVDSCRGCQVYGDTKTEIDYTGSVRYRMMQEVFFATELANELVESIGERNFEMHLDINPNKEHKSNDAMKEAMGYVRGVLGIEPQIKPNSPAASFAADRWTK